MAESHIPVNHPMRPFYRFLAALSGLYILIFGIIALAKTQGTPTFSQAHANNVWVLGLRANLGFAIISVVAGAIVLVCAAIGRNLDRFVNIYGGLLFMIVGMAMLVLLQTNANYLTFSMSNCVASFLIGTVLFSAGLYGKVGPANMAHTDPALQSYGQ
jgi:uncharacterized protein YhhL (DUF1145 family)